MREVWSPGGRIPPEVRRRLYLMVLLLRRFLLATNMLDLTTVLLGKKPNSSETHVPGTWKTGWIQIDFRYLKVARRFLLQVLRADLGCSDL